MLHVHWGLSHATRQGQRQPSASGTLIQLIPLEGAARLDEPGPWPAVPARAQRADGRPLTDCRPSATPETLSPSVMLLPMPLAQHQDTSHPIHMHLSPT